LAEATSLECAKCGAPRDAGRRDCQSCGALCCDRCGASAEATARFCPQCGQVLREDPAPESRQATVVFCDLVGSSSLVQELGAESFHTLLKDYHRECAQVIVDWGGYAAQPLGDGVLAYFGYPSSHEDAARRALSASLDLIEAVARVNRRHARPLRIRIGVDTGTVSVGGAERSDHLAVGEPVNRAARLQAFAAVGTAAVSEATYRLTSGYFHWADLGNVELRGLAGMTHVYRPLGRSSAQNRLQATGVGDLTPFVSAGSHLDELASLWERARSGDRKIVMLTGDAGIGKSRHVLMLTDWVGRDSALALEALCSPRHRATPLYPIVEMMRGYLHFDRITDEGDRLRELKRSIDGIEAPRDTLALLAAALSISTSAGYSPPAYLPQRLHAATLAAARIWVAARAATAPTLLVIEDLHWADRSTIEFLATLSAPPLIAGLMVLATARSDWRKDHREAIGAIPDLMTLALEPLGQAGSQAIVQSLTGERPLPEAILREILDRAGGTPLYLEEITKAVLDAEPRTLQTQSQPRTESSTMRGTGVAVPASLRDALTARLDRLGPGKSLLQLASAIGREFSRDLLLEAADRDASVLDRELATLESAGLLLAPDDRPSKYVFRHALIQEEAYDDLPSATRRRYHQQIAAALARDPRTVDDSPEVMAHHYAQSGDHATAAGLYAKAGQRSMGASAYVEAADAFESAISQLHRLPESPVRDRQEMDLAAARGFTLLSTRGFSDRQVERTYGRALELCQRLGTETPFRVLYGVWAYHLTHGGIAASIDMIPWFERFDASCTDPNGRLAVSYVLGLSAFTRAEFAVARSYMVRASELIDRANLGGQQLALLQEHGFDATLNPLLFLAWIDVIEGRPAACRAKIAEALEIAARSGQPYPMAMAHSVAGAIAHHLSDAALAQEQGEKLMQLAQENHFLYWTGGALCALGWAACHRGAVSEGLPLLEQGLGLFQAMGDRYVVPYYLSYVAETCVRAGDLSRAEQTLAEMSRLAESRGSMAFAADYRRLKGELLRREGDAAGAEAQLRLALSMAIAQGAHLFALRAVTPLAQLLVARGNVTEAIKVLGDVIRALPELPDLPEAAAAADQLRSIS